MMHVSMAQVSMIHDAFTQNAGMYEACTYDAYVWHVKIGDERTKERTDGRKAEF